MGKIIISESQYQKVKQVLIETAIKRQLNEDAYAMDSKNLAFTLKDWAGVNGGQIQILGGSTFKPTGTKGNLLATNAQVKNVQAGGTIAKKNVYYVCGNNKFYVDKVYYDISSGDTTKDGFIKFCETVKKMKKDYYGAESVGGGASYTQTNDRIVKTKDGKTFKIPAKTGYTAKPEKKGVIFKVGPNNFGWFGCESKVFAINKLKYTDADGALANKLVKTLCTSSSSNNSSDNSSDNSSNNSSQTQQPGNNVGGSGSGGSGSVASSSVVSDMANYV
jgi:hypothetical protein